MCTGCTMSKQCGSETGALAVHNCYCTCSGRVGTPSEKVPLGVPTLPAGALLAAAVSVIPVEEET